MLAQVSHPRLLLDPITAVKQSFAAVDKRFLNKAARKADRCAARAPGSSRSADLLTFSFFFCPFFSVFFCSSGSTALVCILINELLIVAHCGDCRMLIRRKDKMFQVTKVRRSLRPTRLLHAAAHAAPARHRTTFRRAKSSAEEFAAWAA